MNFYLIWDEWLAAAAFCALVTIITCFVRREPWGRTAGWTSFAIYISVVPALTLLPIPVRQTPLTSEQLRAGISWMPVVPLLDSLEIVRTYLGRGDTAPLRTFLWNNIGNLLILMPLAVYLHTFFRQSKLRSFLICLGTSILIEIVQAVLCVWSGVMYRVIDINDVLLNGLGALIALGVTAIFHRPRQQKKTRRKKS